MKKVLALTILLLSTTLYMSAQSCPGGIRYRYTSMVQTVWFQDSSSTTIPGPVKEYVSWDFGDGTSDTANGVVHYFPTQSMYWVKKKVKYFEAGNPSNFCISLDSIQIDASLFVAGCNPSSGFRVQWLTGLTYGISSYYNGCPTSLNEVVVTPGTSFTFGSGPMSGIYTSHASHFTYTLPYSGDFTIVQHVTQAAPFTSGQGTGKIIDSIPATPAGCHASFFLVQDSTDLNSWYLYNYSSGSGTLNYLWDFGDGSTSALANPIHTYANVGNYTICLTVSNGSCSDTHCDTAFFDPLDSSGGILDLKTVNMAVSINETELHNMSFNVFPNPAGRELNVAISSEDENFVLTVFDNLGREMHIPAEGSGKNIRLDISGISPGIYMIMLNNGKTIVTKKFIKE